MVSFALLFVFSILLLISLACLVFVSKMTHKYLGPEFVFQRSLIFLFVFVASRLLRGILFLSYFGPSSTC